MNTAQATEYTAFITHRAIRAQVIAHLVSGRSVVCPDCNEIASPETGCTRCDDARFTAQAAEYDALMGGAETSTGCDAYARF